MEAGLLYESPYTNQAPSGVDYLFDDSVVAAIVQFCMTCTIVHDPEPWPQGSQPVTSFVARSNLRLNHGRQSTQSVTAARR